MYIYTDNFLTRMHDHLLSLKQIIKKYNIDTSASQLPAENLNNLENLGRNMKTNMIFPNRDFSILYLFLKSFTNPIKILTLVSILSLIIIYFANQENEVSFTYFIFTIFFLIMITTLEAYQINKINSYYKRKQIKHNCHILIEDQEYNIDSQYIKVGDVLILKEGDLVSADCILINSQDLKIVRSFLVENELFLIRNHLDTAQEFQNSPNVLLCGDQVKSGYGHAVVVRVGRGTEISKFYQKNIRPKNLQMTLLKEINIIFLGTLILALLISLALISIGIFTGIKFEKAIGLTLSICLTLIPNRIPSIISLMLINSVYKLENKGITIRDAGVIEKLGLITIVCAEKEAFVGHMNTLCTCIYNGQKLIDIELAFSDQDEESLKYLERISHITYLIGKSNHELIKTIGQVLVECFDNFDQIPIKTKEFLIGEYKGTIICDEFLEILYISGKVNEILECCDYIQIGFVTLPLKQDKKDRILTMIDELRINYNDFIALASKPFSDNSDMKGFTLVCIYFLEKISKYDASLVMNILRSTHINFSIITALKEDSFKDLVKIFQSVVPNNIRIPNDICMNDRIISGSMYKDESFDLKSTFLNNQNFIVYDSDEKIKQEIVGNLQELKHTVCFLGSSVSDCKALNQADVGICYNSSSLLCKEACNVVLNSDRIDDLLYCIEESRLFFVNLRKSIRFITSHIIPQIVPLFFYSCFGTPIALSPMLLIILNCIVEMPPAIAFVYEEPEYNLLVQKPAKKDDIRLEFQEEESNDEFSVQFANRIINSFEKIRKRRLAYQLKTITFSVIESGIITAICCMLSFFTSLYLDNVPVTKMFYSANQYFSFKAKPLLLKNNIEIDSEEQLDILWKGQSSFFISLVICQMAHLVVCRRSKNYFFKNFFNNYLIISYAVLGILLSFSILYINFLENILFLRSPYALTFIFPAIFASLILLIDTWRKYTLKSKE